jgi:uncharacterized protein (UPF0179 family)
MAKAKVDYRAVVREQFDTMFEDRGGAYTSGYAMSVVQTLMQHCPVGVQKALAAELKDINGDALVDVKNYMTGATVQIRRKDRGTVCDPSREIHWTM